MNAPIENNSQNNVQDSHTLFGVTPPLAFAILIFWDAYILKIYDITVGIAILAKSFGDIIAHADLIEKETKLKENERRINAKHFEVLTRCRRKLSRNCIGQDNTNAIPNSHFYYRKKKSNQLL